MGVQQHICGDGTLVGHMEPDVSLDTVAKTVIPHDLRGIWMFIGYTAVPLSTDPAQRDCFPALDQAGIL